ncbi:ribosome maturation factor RimM [Arcanobacterium phocisimile]|uniref:Ribosome maturation factor RimM n=1 Tax=Arcanobacterium phocisimile TaxID=1302235 RepID=A0ABX7IJS4_9ACTO|nr:ribosome maturation factor RimM [Arcanobacterium phocisimile]QRV02684.1 ribosome maturation factor RimM [Arcanobacterium phocisimile]
MLLTVAIVGAPHGLKGDVKLNVRTDSPERRLVVGKMYETEPAELGPVTIASVRSHKGSTYVTFVEYADRTGAEALRGVKLVVETDEDEIEEDAWYAHELVGLEALDPEGYELGEVTGLEPGPAHDYLIVREPDGILTKVPFVKAIVTEVDLDDNCVIIDAPAGLFSDAELEID